MCPNDRWNIGFAEPMDESSRLWLLKLLFYRHGRSTSWKRAWKRSASDGRALTVIDPKRSIRWPLPMAENVNRRRRMHSEELSPPFSRRDEQKWMPATARGWKPVTVSSTAWPLGGIKRNPAFSGASRNLSPAPCGHHFLSQHCPQRGQGRSEASGQAEWHSGFLEYLSL